MEIMRILRARVLDGRLRLDEPTELPEGTEVDLVSIADLLEAPSLTSEEEQGLETAMASLAEGRGIGVDELKRRLQRFLES